MKTSPRPPGFEAPRRLAGVLLGDIELLCLVAQHHGFTAAARAAGIAPAAVSRSVQRLESRLGVRLLARTTRSVKMTVEGERYVAQCREAIAHLAQAEQALAGGQLQPAGRVRMSLPTSYGHFRVLPLLPALRRRHPEVTLDIQLSNRNVQVVDEGFDLAIRGRHPPDSGLAARKLEDAPLVVVAAPDYLAARGRPRTLGDLVHHECIQFALPSSGRTVPWLFHPPGEAPVELLTAGHLRCEDDILAPVTLARAGAGLTQTYRFLVEDALRTGALEEVLGDCAGASRPFTLLYPANRQLPARVRAVIDFLVEALAAT